MPIGNGRELHFGKLSTEFEYCKYLHTSITIKHNIRVCTRKVSAISVNDRGQAKIRTAIKNITGIEFTGFNPVLCIMQKSEGFITIM